VVHGVPFVVPGSHIPTDKPFRPAETAEFVQVWQEFGLPAALPCGFDVDTWTGPAAAELRSRTYTLPR
jgi:hypothetical protein